MDNKKEKASQSVIEKLVLGVVNWFNLLRGKPKVKLPQGAAKQPQTAPVKESEEKKTGDDISDEGLVEVKPEDLEREEDSVAQDFATLKKFVGKNVDVVKEKVAPGVEATKQAASDATTQVKGANFSWAYKALPLILIIVVLLVAATLVINLSQRDPQENGGSGGNGNGEVVNGENGMTPTPAIYNPYVPSIYAEDTYILRLEEEINVLSHEISTVVLRESLLSLPTPDFNIVFDDK